MIKRRSCKYYGPLRQSKIQLFSLKIQKKSHGFRKRNSKHMFKKSSQIQLCGLIAEKAKKNFLRCLFSLNTKTMLKITKLRIYRWLRELMLMINLEVWLKKRSNSLIVMKMNVKSSLPEEDMLLKLSKKSLNFQEKNLFRVKRSQRQSQLMLMTYQSSQARLLS